jgi:hypothetical protein
LKTVSVTGAGDDSIVLDGDTKDEFYCYDPLGAVLTFSDGTQVRAKFFEHWEITVETRGPADVNIEQAPIHNLDREYTDRVTVTGDLAWVEIDDDGGRGPRRVEL